MQQPQTGPHHQGVGLAAEIGLLAGGHFNRGHQSAAGRSNAAFDGSGHV